MLIFDDLSNILSTIFDDLFKPFKKPESQYQGSEEICLEYPKK